MSGGRNVKVLSLTGEITLTFRDGHVVIRKGKLTELELAEALAATLNHLAADPTLGIDVKVMRLTEEEQGQLDLLHGPPGGRA